MSHHTKGSRISWFIEVLRTRQMNSGGWAYFGCAQESLEATCLAALALGPETEHSGVINFLVRSQLGDGSWPAFRGESEGSWPTALALCTLSATGEFVAARERALRWLNATRGREGHWFWRWKFKTVDRNVRFDPGKYGWPWTSGAASWVIPTAFSIIALKQFAGCNRSESSEKRIRLAVEMLLDRACVGGGWNCGNSVVYGVPLRPDVEATAIALLALQDQERCPAIRAGLDWLTETAIRIQSPESLAWSILSLFLYQEPVEQLKNMLAVGVSEGLGIQNNATLAMAILALRCGEMMHPFEIRR